MRGPHPPENWKRIVKDYQYILAPIFLYLNIFLKDLSILIFLKKTRVNLRGHQEAQVNCVCTFLSPYICFKTKLFLSPGHSISIFFFKTLRFYYFVWSYKNWTEFGFYAKSLSGFLAWGLGFRHLSQHVSFEASISAK